MSKLLSSEKSLNGSVLLRRNNGQLLNSDQEVLAELAVNIGIYELNSLAAAHNDLTPRTSKLSDYMLDHCR